MISAARYHDISCGHRVYGHENKCAHLHGHNYRIFFSCVAEELDSIGRVLDFSAIKEHLCMWVERQWDHKMLLWQEDPWAREVEAFDQTLVVLPFNPTAENMARFLVRVIGPQQLLGSEALLVSVKVEETRKCSAAYSINLKEALELKRDFASRLEQPHYKAP